MGLFSSRKNTSPTTEIPADILADVNINGEKKISSNPATFPGGSSQAGATSGTSPFLKAKAPTNEPTISPIAPVILNPTPSQSATPSSLAQKNQGTETPKTFHFSDQAPLPGEIHFTDVPASPNTQQNDQKPKETFSPSPRPDFSQITQDKTLLERHKEHLKPLEVGTAPLDTRKKELFSRANLLSLVVFLLILSLISGGSWYYLNTRSAQEELPDISIGAMGEIPGGEMKPTTEEGTLLIDQPNYLVLDVETATLEQIKKQLDAEAQKMTAQGITTPVEYLAVDMNSNPVAFSRFAFLIGADSPKDLVEASLEPFSLYLVLDNGELRLALAIPLKPEIGANFPADKAVLPESLKKFFYPEPVSGNSFTNITFRQSNYKNNAISYANIDEQNNWSFDMTLQEGILTVSNSKNALRSVIDKRTLPTE